MALTGREKCERLKKMRKYIADANGILYDIVPCHHEGPCLGTCPVCDAEIRYLDDQLERKILQGSEVQLAGLLGDLFQMAEHTEPGNEPSIDIIDDILMGEALPPDDELFMGDMHVINDDEIW